MNLDNTQGLALEFNLWPIFSLSLSPSLLPLPHSQSTETHTHTVLDFEAFLISDLQITGVRASPT